jgi:hypothetical protein
VLFERGGVTYAGTAKEAKKVHLVPPGNGIDEVGVEGFDAAEVLAQVGSPIVRPSLYDLGFLHARIGLFGFASKEDLDGMAPLFKPVPGLHEQIGAASEDWSVGDEGKTHDPIRSELLRA